MSQAEVVVGVTGGVAAFKTATVVSRLAQSEIGVTVVMTAAATQFVGSATFAALTNRPVCLDTFDEHAFPLGAHIELARRGQVLCVAPATAHFLAKAACGMADDLLSTLVLCFEGPILVAPAMNTEMWRKPSVQRNVSRLREDGFHLLDPEPGWLSCRTQGPGRMVEPERIVAAITAQLERLSAPPQTEE